MGGMCWCVVLCERVVWSFLVVFRWFPQIHGLPFPSFGARKQTPKKMPIFGPSVGFPQSPHPSPSSPLRWSRLPLVQTAQTSSFSVRPHAHGGEAGLNERRERGGGGDDSDVGVRPILEKKKKKIFGLGWISSFSPLLSCSVS